MAKFRYEKDLFGHRGAPIIQDFPIASAQTLVAGDLVYLNSGQVTIAGASRTSVLGLAAEDVTTPAADTMVAVQVAAPGYVYRATADASAATHILEAKLYDINATTQTVDVADASSGCILILETVDSNTDIRILFTEFDLAGIN